MPLDLFQQAHGLALWRGVPLRSREAPVADLREALPDFELRPFGEPPNHNPRLRLIVRMPTGEDPYERPVAAVSDKYDLLQHRVLATWLEENVADAGLHDAAATVVTTEYGEHLRITIPLDGRDRDVARDLLGDEDLYRPEIEVTNSVDRSSAFRVCIR